MNYNICISRLHIVNVLTTAVIRYDWPVVLTVVVVVGVAHVWQHWEASWALWHKLR